MPTTSRPPLLKLKTGAKVGIGEHISDVQKIFRPVFNVKDVSGDGGEFDHLFADGEKFSIGELETEVHLHARPYARLRILSDRGCGVRRRHAVHAGLRHGAGRFSRRRCRTLYRSMQRLLALPAETRLFMCHDYKAPGRDSYAWETTVARGARKNVTSMPASTRRVRGLARGARRDARRAVAADAVDPGRTSAPENCRRRRRTACAISRSRCG